MRKIVMLTALAGEGIDVAYGDCLHCECDATAGRFIEAGQAREFDAETDEGRRVKHLPAAGSQASTNPAGTDADIDATMQDLERALNGQYGQPIPEPDSLGQIDLSGVPSACLAEAGVGVTSRHVSALEKAGLTTVEQVRGTSDETLEAIKGITAATVQMIREGVALIAQGAEDAAEGAADDDESSSQEGTQAE